MDSGFWTSRFAAPKGQLLHHQNQNNQLNSQLDRLNFDEFEVEEEVRPDFPCPYCYEDFDLAFLYSHLEDDHSAESRVTVCSICSVKVAHITLQHGHLFKRCSLMTTRNHVINAGYHVCTTVGRPSSTTIKLIGYPTKASCGLCRNCTCVVKGGEQMKHLIIQILAQRNASQRKCIQENYSTTFGKDLLTALDKELSSDFEDLFVVRCAYHARYKKSLEEDIAHRTTGDFRKISNEVLTSMLATKLKGNKLPNNMPR